MNKKIIWHNEKRKIRELIPYVANPRHITDKQARDLKASLDKFGLADPLIVNLDNTIIGGHQRKKIMETLLGYDPDYEVDVRIPSRELTVDEMRELNIRLNKNVAEWDFEILANNYDLNNLMSWGFLPSDFDIFGSEEQKEPEIIDKYLILIECSSEQQRKGLIEKFASDGLICRAVSNWREDNDG